MMRGRGSARWSRGVDGGVDAELGDLPGENAGGVEVGEGRRRRGVGQVVGGDVDRLHRRDRSLLGGGDPLLQVPHLRGEGRLVADGRGHAAEERRDLGARLGEAEDVVDEEQDVRSLIVAEGLGHGQAREGHAKAGPRRLGHLSVDEGRLGLGPGVGVDLGEVEVAGLLPVAVELLAHVDDLGLDELPEEIVPLTGPLADAGEDREAAVTHGDVVDELHDEHRLADAGAAEEAGLAALGVGLEEVDDLDPRLEHLGARGEVHQGRSRPVNGHGLLGIHRPHLVDGLADDVQDAPQDLAADGRRDRLARVGGRHAAHQPFRRFHGNGADRVLAEVLGDLEDETRSSPCRGRSGPLP